jgi:hypothetical protein
MKFFVYLLLMSTILFANIAKITSLEGEIFVKRESNILAKVGMDIKEKDTIITKNNSKALILFNDNTTISIGKNSSFSIEEYLYEPKANTKPKALFKFNEGIYRTITGTIGKLNPKKFIIKTSKATIGIRGSDGSTIVLANGDVKHITHFGAFILTDNATNFKVDIKQGEIGIRTKEDVFVLIATEEDLEEVEDVYTKEEDLEEVETDLSSNTNQIKDILDTIAKEEKTDIQPLPNDIVNLSPLGDIRSIDSLTKVNKAKQIIDTYKNTNSDSYLEYGYWATHSSDITKRTESYLSGVPSVNEMVDDYIARKVVANYNGNIASFVTNNGVSTSSDGTINLQIDFDQKNITGNLNVINGDWKATINNGTLSKNTNTNTYEITSTNIATSGGSVADISGNLEGKFFGENLDSVGGKFQLNSNNNGIVNGVFGAKK